MLDLYDSSVAESFDRIEPLAARPARYGHRRLEAKELLEHIGAALLAQWLIA